MVQRLFATGLSLQGTMGMIHSDPDSAGARIEAAIDELDLTVKHIRSAIFGLQSTGPVPESLRGQVLDLCRETTQLLGFEPQVLFDGPLDTLTSEEVSADLTATLHEALTNVARHARASRVDVEVTADDDQILLRVRDDGIGPPAGDVPHGNGLANMAVRAQRHGGDFSLGHGPSTGSVVEWRVPIKPVEPPVARTPKRSPR